MRFITSIILIITTLYSTKAYADEPTDTLAHELKEVVVVAQEKTGTTTSSRIDRAAMQHLQPTSFADILELLPGNVSQDPKMGQANTITLRETGTLSATGAKTDNDRYAISSLGTSFVVDGSPISTDADMQSVAGVDTSDPSARRSTVNRGVDMRTLSTDNIESVEIVRGIPSAEYGNLTSGLVNIKRVRKATPFTFRFKADEYSKLFYAGKGFAIGASGHTLNVNLGYLDAKTDPRNNLENYKRITALAMPTFRFQSSEFSTIWNIAAEYTGSFDNSKIDPDLNLNKIDEYTSRYSRYALSSDLNITLYNLAWLKHIVVNASASYDDDRITRRKQVAPGRAALAPSGYEEGEHCVSMLPGEYIANYRVDGRPFSTTLKGKADGMLTSGAVTIAYKGGIEWSLSKNYGKGQVYDLSRPLSAVWTTRPRAFKDIPSMQTFSWFAEDNLTLPVGENSVEMQAGVRGMVMPGLDKRYYLSGHMYLDPRFNAVWNFPVIDAERPLRFHIAAGWGQTTRMPTLDYLYPQAHYNDIIQFNYYDTEAPAERSVVNVRTYKVDATNYDLRAATNGKWEVSFVVSWGNNRLTATYFEECMNNGFRYTPIYSDYSYRKYDAEGFNPMNPDFSAMTYTDCRILDGFSRVTNGTHIEKRGIEYTIQTERFRPIATAVTINGAWLRSTYSNSQALYSPVNDVIGNQAVSDMYVGIYDTRDGRVNEQFNTNFMFDTQIPRWGLIFTTSIQCMWYVKTTRLKENGISTAYIAAEDGLIHPYDSSSMADPILRYLVKTYNDDAFATVKIPVAVYLNLKASKQIGRWLRLSAFVNRIVDYLPDYKSNGLTMRRSADAYFGMEATITI